MIIIYLIKKNQDLNKNYYYVKNDIYFHHDFSLMMLYMDLNLKIIFGLIKDFDFHYILIMNYDYLNYYLHNLYYYLYLLL